MFGLTKDRTVAVLEKIQEQQAQQLSAIRDSVTGSLDLVSKSVAALVKKPDETSLARIGDAQRPVAVDWSGYGSAHGDALVRLEEYKDDKKRKDAERQEQLRIEKQKRVAYALNLCMVSLSQIVDYQDINVLQQEYDAVLNNLNMEKVEKDEPLLDALKKILDVCHFYLLHAKDKEILKKKQAARLKGALGKALGGGNVMAIFGTPNPWAIGAGILAMVGTAAIRYKSERDKAKLENEVEEWELEKSALEQLHNLRRVLFETSWRLAEKYKFPDRYRLTEKQIEIYDDILTDPDPMNRYERLELIKDNFEAYPLFWYYLGRAALETANLYKPVDKAFRESTPGIERLGNGDADVYHQYMKLAKSAFDGFRKAHDGNEILREDLLSASAYLDYACFFDDPSSILEYTDKAKALAGMDFEINQMCAFRYLQVHDLFEKAGDNENAKKSYLQAEHCLRFLLNEGFNPALNGRALSTLYKKYARTVECQKAYKLLKARVQRKNPCVYNWILPWDDVSLRQDIDAYLSGDGIRRTIFNYHYGRLMLIYGDFFAAISQARRDNNLQPIRDLKENYKLSGALAAWDKDLNVKRDEFKDWKSEEDPMFGCHQQFWSVEAKTNSEAGTKADVGESVIKETESLQWDFRKSAAELEYDFVSAIKNFIHATSERKWYTLGLYRHDTDYCASVLDSDVMNVEAAAVSFIKDVASKTAHAFVEKHGYRIKADLEFPEDAKYESPIGLQIIWYMESEAERMRHQIENTIACSRYAYPIVKFDAKGKESFDRLTAYASVPLVGGFVRTVAGLIFK